MFCPLPLFLPQPERIQGGSHGFASDIWSLGLTLTECAQGSFPYQQPQVDYWTLLNIIKDQEPPQLSEEPGAFSKELKDFVRQCLQKDPRRRPSAEQLLVTHNQPLSLHLSAPVAGSSLLKLKPLSN